MRFRLTTIAYVFALFATAMSLFGGWGVAIAIAVLAAWRSLLTTPQSHVRVLAHFVTAIALSLVLLLIPSVFGAREAASCSACLGRMFGLAHHLHWRSAVESGTFPPAQVTGLDGKPNYSWRFQLMMDDQFPSVRSAYRLNEPWHSKHNRLTTSGIDPQYVQCCAHASAAPVTHYFAVVGEHTAWPPGRGRRLDEFPDGVDRTILLIEAPHRASPWVKPADLSFDEAVRLLSGDDVDQAAHSVDWGYLTKSTRALNVAFANGKTATLHVPLARETAIALLTADGGESISDRDLERSTRPQLDYARCYALAAFVALPIWPAWRRRAIATGTPATC